MNIMNRTHLHKSFIIFFTAVSAGSIFFVSGASAQTALFQSIDQHAIDKGYTFSYEKGAFKLAVPPAALSGPTDVRIVQEYTKESGMLLAPPPAGAVFASDAYSYTFSDASLLTRVVTVVITSTSNDALSALYQYNEGKKQWERLSSSRSDGRSFRSSTGMSHGIFAVLHYTNEDSQLSALLGSSRALLVGDTQYHTFVAQNTGEILPLASLTKLMTALVFLDSKVAWDKKVTIVARDAAPPAKVNFTTGDVVTVHDLFLSMLVGSKNNSAKALARSTGKSEKEFIKKMNQKARNFGMTQTSFGDVTGLSEKNTSTARDYYRLARVAFGNGDIKRAVQTRSMTVHLLNRKKNFVVHTTDELLDHTKKVYGKTGYIPESGYNLALFAEQKGTPLIVIILGAPSSEDRFDLAGAILRHRW